MTPTIKPSDSTTVEISSMRCPDCGVRPITSEIIEWMMADERHGGFCYQCRSVIKINKNGQIYLTGLKEPE